MKTPKIKKDEEPDLKYVKRLEKRLAKLEKEQEDVKEKETAYDHLREIHEGIDEVLGVLEISSEEATFLLNQMIRIIENFEIANLHIT